jgi:hypothetical protein
MDNIDIVTWLVASLALLYLGARALKLDIRSFVRCCGPFLAGLGCSLSAVGITGMAFLAKSGQLAECETLFTALNAMLVGGTVLVPAVVFLNAGHGDGRVSDAPDAAERDGHVEQRA